MDTSHSRVLNVPSPRLKVVVDGVERGGGEAEELSSDLSLPNSVGKTQNAAGKQNGFTGNL